MNKTETYFNGPEYQKEFDLERLSNQHERIKMLMLDGKWRTISEISDITGDQGTSVSSHLRHLRKKRFGSYIVERRSSGNRSRGLFEYRVLNKEETI